MNDERFFDLAMKVIARQSSDAERAELEALLAQRPELKVEFERLQEQARITKEALPLMEATKATTGQLPGYARERLQTKVRQTIGRPETSGEGNSKERSAMWVWQKWLGLATAVAVVVLFISLLVPSENVTVQLAMLDLGGATRSGITNEAPLLTETWKGSSLDTFSATTQYDAWANTWPDVGKGFAVKIVYDKTAGELRVVGRGRGTEFTNTFTVDSDLNTALARAKAYVEERTAN